MARLCVVGTSQRPRRTPHYLLIALLLGALSLTGCVKPGRTVHPDSITHAGICPVTPAPEITTQVRIAWQPIPNGDLIVKDKQWLENCLPNAHIQWLKMNSGGDVLQAFGSGSIDLAQIGSSPAVKGRSTPLNLALRVVWLHDVIGPAEALVVRDSGAHSLKDLAGKKIGTPFGSTSHFSLQAAIDQANLKGKVQLVNLQPEAMIAAWDKGDIDAAWVWDPVLSTLKQMGKVLVSSLDTANAGAPTFDLEAGNTEFIHANPDFMRIWTQLQGAAVNTITENPADAAASMSAQLGTTEEAAMKLLDGYKYLSNAEQLDSRYFGKDLPKVLQATATFLLAQQEIDRIPPISTFDNMADSDFIREAK